MQSTTSSAASSGQAVDASRYVDASGVEWTWNYEKQLWQDPKGEFAAAATSSTDPSAVTGSNNNDNPNNNNNNNTNNTPYTQKDQYGNTWMWDVADQKWTLPTSGNGSCPPVADDEAIRLQMEAIKKEDEERELVAQRMREYGEQRALEKAKAAKAALLGDDEDDNDESGKKTTTKKGSKTANNKSSNSSNGSSANKVGDSTNSDANDGDTAVAGTSSESNEKKRKRTKKKKKGWNRKAENTSVFVTNLPSDATIDEVAKYFEKSGILKKDPATQQPKIRLYNDEHGHPKGEALITYFRKESVPHAIKFLDSSAFRPDHGQKQYIGVKEAVFELKGDFAERKRARGLTKEQLIKMKRFDQSKELGWEEEEKRHVVLKHMFDPKEAWTDPQFFDDLRTDIGTECEKMGALHSISIFEHNPQGVMVLKFETPYGAKQCVETMRGRFFAGKEIDVAFYDGFTNYHVEESDESKAKRDEVWRKHLDDQ